MDAARTASTYQKVKHRVSWISLALNASLLVFVFYSGLSVVFKLAAASVTAHPSGIIAIYLLQFSLLFYCVHLPLDIFTGFIWEHKFKLSRQSFGQWFTDDLKKNVIGFILGLVLVEVFYMLLARYPHYWWVGAGTFWLLLSFIMARLTPTVIVPLFYKYVPMDHVALNKQILDLCQSCGVSLKGVYQIDFSRKTTKANAFLCGVGRSRRVVLSDTLVKEFTSDEVMAVVAHELGHYRHKDILRLLAANTGVIFLGLYCVHIALQKLMAIYDIAYMDDIVLFPLLVFVLMILGVGMTPVLNAYSRHIERRADAFCLKQTGNPAAFISMMHKLAGKNMAEMQPSWLTEFFFYDHPSVQKRIAMARAYEIS